MKYYGNCSTSLVFPLIQIEHFWHPNTVQGSRDVTLMKMNTLPAFKECTFWLGADGGQETTKINVNK